MTCIYGIMNILNNVFGYNDFKNDIQRKAVFAVAEGLTDVCISMPSECDRNLCFQLPALLKKGKVVIVFSPDMHLIKKQIKFLESKEIGTCLLYASMFNIHRMKILKDLTSAAPKLTFIYCTPNMISMIDFMEVILRLKEQKLLSYIVFNEAHCVSEWEYEYTNYYERVKQFEEVYGGIQRVAVAPVVTHKVLQDISQLLSLKNPTICQMLMQQSNVHYDTCNIDGLHQPIDDLYIFLVQTLDCTGGPIQKTDQDSAIIYCRKATEAEELKNKLHGCGIPTLACHYKTKLSSRGIIESKWISGEGCVMTTTYDYGFIHTRPIRVVVYWTVPESIRKYYRESTRPHKENARIHSRIYFSTKEYTAIKLAIETNKEMNSKDHVKNRLNELEELVSYCSSTMCRHVYIFKYFGLVMPTCKTNCDVCITQSIQGALISESEKYLENRENTECNIHCLNEDSKDKEKGIVRNNDRILKNLPLNSEEVCMQTSDNKNNKDLQVTETRIQRNKERSLKNQLLSCQQTHLEISDNEKKKEKSVHSRTVLSVRRIRQIHRGTNCDKKDIINNLPIPEHTLENESLVCEAEWIETRKRECRKVENTQSSAMLEILQNNSLKCELTYKDRDDKNSEYENAQSSVALQIRKITKDKPHAKLSNKCVIKPKFLINKYNLNENKISLLPVISIEDESGTTSQIDQRDNHTIHGQVSTQKSKRTILLDDTHLKNFNISNVKTAKSVSSGNYSAVTNDVRTNERNKTSNKRRIYTNVHEELKPIKRRKIVSDNESINNTKLNINKRILVQHNEDSETECGWIDFTPPEVLMKKLNLNKSEITLERRIVGKTKR